MGDCRPYWWRPHVVTREVGVVERAFLKKTDVFRVMGQRGVINSCQIYVFSGVYVIV